eukprot:scaffold189893_cov19-Tisochrysis_lutea.AAC.1
MRFYWHPDKLQNSRASNFMINDQDGGTICLNKHINFSKCSPKEGGKFAGHTAGYVLLAKSCQGGLPYLISAARRSEF